jgi:hypothetical protein
MSNARSWKKYQMKRRLPLGIQSFAKIREGNYVYVDKTARIYELIIGSLSQVFLSRPRRFGKSLLCSTLRALFEGRRELFNALAIDSADWEWKKHPVIHIDLNAGNYSNGVITLNEQVNVSLGFCEQDYEIAGTAEHEIAVRFRRLIKNLAGQSNEKVVVIIDEYDKPLLSTIDYPQLHTEMRDALKGFYSVLKSADEYLRFVFFTGVTKFSQVSIFSDLNQLADISLDPRYCDLCGITQEEMERDFGPEIDGIVREGGKDREEYIGKLKRFYNGYRFSKNPLTVYNPFGLLNHFDKGGEFSSYWYSSATPTFLIKLIENQHIDVLHLGEQTVHSSAFHKYDVETMEAVPVLYQSGYLTIVDYDDEQNSYALDFPNEEVRASFAESLVEKYLHVGGENLNSFIMRFLGSLIKGDVDGIMDALKPFFASIPYDLIANTENYYQTVIHLVFTMLGLQCRSEVRIAAGRIDTLVETKKFVYCFEFKLEGTAEEAIAQIDTKDYLLPWSGSGKKLFKIGVDFDKEKRNIGEYVFEGGIKAKNAI